MERKTRRVLGRAKNQKITKKSFLKPEKHIEVNAKTEKASNEGKAQNIKKLKSKIGRGNKL